MYVVQIEVSFVSTGLDSNKYLAPFWRLHLNIAWHTFRVMRIEKNWNLFFFFFYFKRSEFSVSAFLRQGHRVLRVRLQWCPVDVLLRQSVFIFSVFMWRHRIPKLKITCPSEVSVPPDKSPYRTLTFGNVLARQGSSFCNRARLNFRAFALRDTKVAAQEGCRVGQKMSYRYRFC